MAHFVIPPDEGPTGYDVDGKHAPGSVWRMQIRLGGARRIGLWGGAGLFVRSNNPMVVVVDTDHEETRGDLRVLNLTGERVGTSLIEVGKGSAVWIRLQVQVLQPVTTSPHTLIIRDVRLAGWAPKGDVVEVDAYSPVKYIMDVILKRSREKSGNLKVIFMAHGLPGFVQCGKGGFDHPTAGPGMTIADNLQFERLRGAVTQLSFYSCLVARIGDCHECGPHKGYDGNQFCYIVAQSAQTRVRASTHLQYYWDGTVKTWKFKRPDGKGIRFGTWNGTVFTWGPSGKILSREDYPYHSPSRAERND